MKQTIQYGSSPVQSADWYCPKHGQRLPVVCLLHGGFWRAPHGRDQLDAVALDWAARGYAVWNIGYRRSGDPGGGWPGTLQDVVDAVAFLDRLAAQSERLDLERIAIVGHSAGGQLALWLGARNKPAPFRERPRVEPAYVLAQAPVADLAQARAQHLGNDAVEAWLGDTLAEITERIAIASPTALLPLRVPHAVVHGTQDNAIPVALSRAYVEAARARGDAVRLIELADAGHMDFLDPGSQAHRAGCAWLSEQFDTRAR